MAKKKRVTSDGGVSGIIRRPDWAGAVIASLSDLEVGKLRPVVKCVNALMREMWLGRMTHEWARSQYDHGNWRRRWSLAVVRTIIMRKWGKIVIKGDVMYVGRLAVGEEPTIARLAA